MGFFTKIKNKISNSVAAKVAVGAVIVALLGGGTVVLAYASGLTGEKTAVGVAFFNTFVTDANELFKEVKEQGGELSMELSGQELSLDTFGVGGGMSLPNPKFLLSAKSNPEQELNATLELRVSNNTLLTANAYVNQEQWQVSVPKLFSAVLTGKHNAEESQKKSASDGISKELLEKLCKAYEEYLSDTEIKKGRKEELRINGVPYSCRVYQAAYEAEQVKGFIAAVMEALSAYGMETGDAPALTGKVYLTFHVCKERMVSIGAKWTSEAEEDGKATTYPGSLKLLPSRDGNFSLQVSAEGKEWNVKGCLKVAQNEVTPLKGKTLDVLAMTEEEEAALRLEISKNIAKLMFRWMGLLR